MAADEITNKNIWENSKIRDLYNQPFDYEITENGFIIIKQPQIVLAKFALVNWYFMPEPENNRFQDILLNFDNALHDVEYWQKKYKKEKRKKIFFLAGGITMGILTGILIIKIKIKLI